jgi:hypothetical protein
MNLFVLAVLSGGWLGLLEEVAIIVVVVWAIWALLEWLGVKIPRPIQILLIALVCIVAIVLLFRMAAMLMAGG